MEWLAGDKPTGRAQRRIHGVAEKELPDAELTKGCKLRRFESSENINIYSR